ADPVPRGIKTRFPGGAPALQGETPPAWPVARRLQWSRNLPLSRARSGGQILPPVADHEPSIPATRFPAELTPRALILGVVLGLIFSASSVYLALKIGLTVSSSIPIAVL